ncbi:FG-GAP-like repeat-containing protein [Rhodopirellula sp. P2]|uniref:FG-GAP-like repeat-containing protein n=1 Tax=Rhodopirellula sp. P2 TaxID=2127060 RepID=UPI00236851A4|nr:FG-GAP-like repeat-containing protein [Rhodopirellula sp. P2]WDQ15088.1 FG-GAP-like repeat-containing protein [Rhodopirellula sp. P2]
MFSDSTRRFQVGTTLFAFSWFAWIVGCSTEPSDFEKLRKQQQHSETNQATSKLDVDEQIALARQELKLGSAERAEAMLEPILMSHPERTDVMRLMAEVQHRTGHSVAAADLLASIPYSNPDRSSAAKLKAVDWYLQANAYEPAIELLMNAVETTTGQDRFRHRLVEVLNQTGQRMAAFRVLQPLIREGKASERDLFSAITRGEAFIDETLSAPDFTKQSLASLSLARRQHDEANLSEANELLSDLRKSYPGSTAIAAFQGRVLADLQDFDSLQAWRESLPANIQDEPEYWHAFGKLASHRNNPEVAIRCFGEAIQRDPTDRKSLVLVARSFRQLGLNEEAETAMRQFEMLERTSELAKIFGLASGTPAQYREMADLLSELGRPWESIAWERIAVAMTGNQPLDEAALSQKRKHLMELDASDSPSQLDSSVPWSRENLSQWPLPASLDSVDLHQEQASQQRASSQLSSAPAPIRFRNVAPSLNLHFQYDNGDDQTDNKFYLHQQTGGGLGILDFDRDGWVDLYCAQAGIQALDAQSPRPNQLFRNFTASAVQDVTQESQTGDRGYGQGIAVADINQDGFPDLLVANIGVNVAFQNNGDGTFARVELPPEGDGKWTTSIACGDLNGDHLPEIIEVNYIDDPSAFEIPCVPDNDACGPSRFQPAADRWLSLNAQGAFRSFSNPEGSQPNAGHGFAVLLGNLNGQLGNDVYIANDGDANHFWQNRGPRSLASVTDETPLADSQLAPANQATWIAEETASLSGIATSQLGGRHGSMGLAFADFDRNALPDLHVTNYWDQEADLYLQEDGETFQHSSRGWQIHERSKPTVGWGSQAADFDRDGRADLMVLNGHIVDHRHRGVPFQMLPQLFQGHDNHFEFVSESTAADAEQRDAFWTQPTLGRTLAVLDWNRDGLPDVLANHLDQPATLLQNESAPRAWLQLELIGTRSERDAIGATVEIQCGTERWTHWQANGGFLANNEALLDIGLGDSEHPCQVMIEWPSGSKQTLANLAPNHRYVVIEGESTTPWTRRNHSRK